MLQHIPLASRNYFLADITDAEASQAAGVEAGTLAKCDLVWWRWLLYCIELGFTPNANPFLSDIDSYYESYSSALSCSMYDSGTVHVEANHLKPVPVMMPLTTWHRNLKPMRVHIHDSTHQKIFPP
jgi:hypothetical protein